MRNTFLFLAKRLLVSAAAIWMPQIGLAFTSEVVRFETLDRQGTNYKLAAAEDGRLYLAFRSGAGNLNASMTNVYGAAFNPQTRLWSGSILVGTNCSRDIHNNQPAIARDPAGGAWIAYSQDYRMDCSVGGYQMDSNATSVAGPYPFLGTGNWFGAPSIQEIRNVDVRGAPDGRLWAGWCFFDSALPSANGIFLSNNGEAGGEERATAQDSTASGFALALGPEGLPHVVTVLATSVSNAAWARRESLNPVPAAAWQPDPLFFSLPFTPHLVAAVDTDNNDQLRIAVATAINTIQFGMLMATVERHDDSAAVTQGSFLQVFASSNAADSFDSPNPTYARSPLGHEAVAYSMDGDLSNPMDLAVVMVKPRTVPWPQGAFIDANGDGVHDDMAGPEAVYNVFSGPSPPPYHVFQGTEGRFAAMFAYGETPAVGFSGESLWIVFNDDTSNAGRAALVTFPETDLDWDGMYDEWETRHGLDPNDPADAAGNPDQDGYSNLQEFIADTDPTNSNPVLSISAWSNAPGGNIHFESSPERRYELYFCSNLTGGGWTSLTNEIGGASNGLPVPWEGTNAPTCGFCRVRARLP